MVTSNAPAPTKRARKPIKKGGTYLDPEAEAKIAAVANQGK